MVSLSVFLQEVRCDMSEGSRSAADTSFSVDDRSRNADQALDPMRGAN